MRWDVQKNQVNKELQKVIAKTVAGLMNSEGGTLVIGLTDDGDIFGLEADMKTLGRANQDGFLQALVQTLDNYLGTEFIAFVKPRFEARNGKTICIVEAEASPKPVFLRDGLNREFYIRAGNTTRALDLEAAHEFIGMHWQS